MPLIFTVDDDRHLLALVEHQITNWGYAFCGVRSAKQMWQQFQQAIPSVIMLDMALGDEDGALLLGPLKKRFPSVPIIIITAHATIETAVTTLKNGAYDYICKPLDFDRLRIELDKAVSHNRLSLQVKAFQSARRKADFHDMIGRSEPMQKVYRLIETVAPTDATVLLLGRTGTGKELAARAIHECSNRSDGPFIAVNAPAIPHELIESALFGHEKGAFTGAHQQHIGFCEQANGGTLFLDEICEMDYNVQAKLLRFLQDHVVQRVGSKSAGAVDVRVIAATNRDPNVQIQNDRLREDFYYRLSVVTINMVPLRERPGDIALLARYFLDLAAAKYGKHMSAVCPEAMKLLNNCRWPGNVRQLEHVINQVVITNNAAVLTADMLPRQLTSTATVDVCDVRRAGSSNLESLPSIEQMQRQLIVQTLELTCGSVPAAAEHLGLSEATLYRKIKKFGLSRQFVKQ